LASSRQERYIDIPACVVAALRLVKSGNLLRPALSPTQHSRKNGERDHDREQHDCSFQRHGVAPLTGQIFPEKQRIEIDSDQAFSTDRRQQPPASVIDRNQYPLASTAPN